MIDEAMIDKARMRLPNLQAAERALLYALPDKIEKVERRSAKLFDLHIEGVSTTMNCLFMAWVPLLIIREYVEWTRPSIAAMTDYPEMTAEGDW